ncbi:hypothetical protein HN512_01410 [Candidatus Peregrinibacteria bacterium]|jgi:hypothetical protein|nr:hypothetical protein [Candidatus Peregrinibacteria bacterium]MBT3598474.1 hypothetical protein [Candidatus Peregrinibacteria bacterium]MBT4367135.1 hypothetical protein [Candidatus Peregrinibacteria bacterium]MBT4586004.1 hypothetical protein [Candidatus Peregrinibacteria bacterium]MBT6730857.1 hypothetical protein [Candidatus Peregrinibacteria bacterium]
MNKTKILIFNCAHCRGYNGSIAGYIFGWIRYCISPKRRDKAVSKAMADCINRENPDICFISELLAKSSFVDELRELFSFNCISMKYGDSWFKHLPFSGNHCNGFFANEQFPVLNRNFKYGIKRHLFDIELSNNTSIFFSHLAVNRSTRTKQIEQIGDLNSKGVNMIMCGDFNIYGGLKELDSLKKKYDFKIANTDSDKTFPSHKPRHILDVFLCSKDIDVHDVRVISSMQLSDHLPIILECSIP